MRARFAALFLAAALILQALGLDPKLLTDYDDMTAQAVAIIAVVDHQAKLARDNGAALHPSIVLHRAGLESAMDHADRALRDHNSRGLAAALRQARGHLNRLHRSL